MRNELEDLSEKDQSQLFYHDLVNEVGERYVAWIDLMGILDHMENEQVYPTILRGELLAAVSEYADEDIVSVFTIGDGVIMVTEDENYLMEFLNALFVHYVRFNVKNWRNNEEVYLNRLIRAGIGFGEVHRINIGKYEEEHYNGNIFHKNFSNNFFGPGIIKALRAEKGAPYGAYKYNNDGKITPIYWWKKVRLDKESRIDIIRMLQDYFDWYKDNPRYRYQPSNHNHLDRALDYFEISASEL